VRSRWDVGSENWDDEVLRQEMLRWFCPLELDGCKVQASALLRDSP